MNNLDNNSSFWKINCSKQHCSFIKNKRNFWRKWSRPPTVSCCSSRPSTEAADKRVCNSFELHLWLKCFASCTDRLKIDLNLAILNSTDLWYNNIFLYGKPSVAVLFRVLAKKSTPSKKLQNIRMFKGCSHRKTGTIDRIHLHNLGLWPARQCSRGPIVSAQQPWFYSGVYVRPPSFFCCFSWPQ